jgi:hypothetical protein
MGLTSLLRIVIRQRFAESIFSCCSLLEPHRSAMIGVSITLLDSTFSPFLSLFTTFTKSSAVRHRTLLDATTFSCSVNSTVFIANGSLPEPGSSPEPKRTSSIPSHGTHHQYLGSTSNQGNFHVRWKTKRHPFSGQTEHGLGSKRHSRRRPIFFGLGTDDQRRR